MTITRKTFTAEFKPDTTKLAKTNGNTEKSARNLGIGVGLGMLLAQKREGGFVLFGCGVQ